MPPYNPSSRFAVASHEALSQTEHKSKSTVGDLPNRAHAWYEKAWVPSTVQQERMN
jgi:hypothetical protein